MKSGCERKGQQRLDKIRADHDSEGANTKSLGAAAQRKHRDRGSGSQRPSGSLKIATMRAKEDVHQETTTQSLSASVSQTKSPHAPLSVWPATCSELITDRLRTSLHILTPNFQLASPTDKPMHHNSTFMTVLIAPDPAIRNECLAPNCHWAALHVPMPMPFLSKACLCFFLRPHATLACRGKRLTTIHPSSINQHTA